MCFGSSPSVVEFGVPQVFGGASKIAVGFARWESPVFRFTSSALVSTTRRTRDRPFLCFKVVETRRDRACLPGGRDSRMVPLVMSFGARLIRCRGRVEGVWGRLRNLPVLGRALQGLKALLYWISCALALGIYIYII